MVFDLLDRLSDLFFAPEMTVSARLGMALVVLATTCGAMFTVLCAGGSGSLEVLPVRLIYDSMAVLAIVPWLILGAYRHDWLPSSQLMPAIAAIVVAFAVTTVTSRVPRLSAEMLGYAILLAELYLLLVVLMRNVRLRAHFARLAAGLGLVVCVQYLVQVLQAWQVWWGVVGRLAIPPLRPPTAVLSLGSPNPVATLALLLCAFALATLGLRGLRVRAIAVVLVALVAVTTLITGSRGAWLGATAGLTVCALAMAAVAPGIRTRVIARLRTRLGVMAVVAGLAAIVAAGVLAAASHRLTLGDDGYRAAFAAESLRMFQSSPLVGVGPGVWQVLRASYATALELDYYIPHAHNIYLQTIAEFGLVGALAGFAVVGALARLLLSSIRSDDLARRHVGLAVLFGVVLLAGQQLADMLMNVPAILLAIAMPLAWLDATAPAPVRSRQTLPSGARLQIHAKWRRVLVLGMAAVTLVVATGLLRLETITMDGLQGVKQANDGDWVQAADAAGRAAASDPSVTSYWFEVGVTAANAGDLATAADALGRSAGADDYSVAWVDLAAVRWQLGDTTGSRDALVRAERLGWQRATVAVAAGWLRWQLGDRTAAIGDYGAAVVVAPTLASDPFWNSDPELSQAWPAIMDAARQQVERSPGGLEDHVKAMFELRLLAGDAAGARAEAAALSTADRDFYDMTLQAWQRLPGAEAALQQLAQRNPLDGRPAAWCQLVAARYDERDLVDRYGIWLTNGLGMPPPIARVVFGGPVPQPDGGLDRYGSLYRRLVPDAEIVGILPQIAWQDHF